MSGEDIVKTANSLLGTKYKYGGSTVDGFDCSGFVYYFLIYSKMIKVFEINKMDILPLEQVVIYLLVALMGMALQETLFVGMDMLVFVMVLEM